MGMSIFWLNNIHFAVEFFGAVALITAAWLAFDAYLLTREKKALLKVLGFCFFAVWQVLHALDIAHEGVALLGMGFLIGGLFFILLNIILETPPSRPKIFELVFVIPSVAGLLGHAYLGAGILSLLAAYFTFRRYRVELNKPLKPLGVGFAFLAASFLLGSASTRHLAPDFWWMAEHVLRLCGFGALTVWVWQYLRLRLKEELLLIFVAMSLTVSLVVTFTFSALLLERMRTDAYLSLQANARVFSYMLNRIADELASKSIVASRDADLQSAVGAGDFGAIEERAKILQQALGVDFLTIADETGAVVQRANLRTARGDMVSSDQASAALAGNVAGGVSVALPEGLSVRGASPLAAREGALLGIVEVGKLLDNIFLDNFKKVTGLDATVFAGDVLHASTILDIDGVTRPLGVKITDERILKKVLENASVYTGSATFLGKPHLASYVPLRNARGQALGMVATSRPEVEISKAAIATNRLTLFTTLLIVLALLIPAYLIVRKISEEE